MEKNYGGKSRIVLKAGLCAAQVRPRGPMVSEYTDTCSERSKREESKGLAALCSLLRTPWAE